MDIYSIVLNVLFGLIIIYILWNQWDDKEEKKTQALLFNISIMFLDTKDKRQDEKCKALIEMLGSFLNAEHIILKLKKETENGLPEFHWWKDSENNINTDAEAELTLELKHMGEILGTITIRGTSAINKLKKQKLMIIPYLTKLVNRFYEENTLYHMAYYDQLTRLPNRSYFLKIADEANEVARRANEMVAYMFFDLDAFKNVNDRLGHEGGDELLKAVADRLCMNKNIFSIAARYGGDEYLVMLEHITKMEQVILTAETLMRMFEEPFALSGKNISITASVGISLYPFHGNNVNELLVNADKAMYQSKARGKNQYDIVPIAEGCL